MPPTPPHALLLLQERWLLGLMLLCSATVGAGLALLLQRRRNRGVIAAAEARFTALLAERDLLAREIQDTMLQRFTGITLRIDGVRNSLQQQSNPLADDLSRILDQADEILRESAKQSPSRSYRPQQ